MTDTPNPAALMKDALREIQRLRSALAEAKGARREPIAIIGMGCRFPGGANDPSAYWRLLAGGTDAITDVPPSRWDVDAFYDADPDAAGKMYTRHGGFIGDVDRFDARFFGVSPLDATNMDPQQRLLLEVAWEALEHAGQVPGAVARTGVYVGSFMDDYLQLNFHAAEARAIDAWNTLGLLRGLAAGRLAYALDLHGPAMQVDTACSSSLLAAHLAVQALRNRECDLALAGGVNLTLAPEVTIGLCRMKAMAADGRCKSFDARADGYVRGEGCGIIVLKRLSDAMADRDAVYAVIRGSAVNHDGRSNGLTAPNGSAQRTVIREALADAGVSPDEVQLIEAHGTGTSLGDPIEAMAIGEVLCRDRSEPLLIGSVKSNFGHLESAAGAAALMKVALSLHHGAVPPSLHFEQPNPHIPWERLPIAVPTRVVDWPAGAKRVAGVSSFGMSGTNVHMIVEEAPPRASADDDAGIHVLTISAASEAALDALAAAYATHLETTDQPLRDICHTSNAGRRHFEFRRAVAGESREELARELRQASPRRSGATRKRSSRPFVFPREAADAAAVREALALLPDLPADLLERDPGELLKSRAFHRALAAAWESGIDIDWSSMPTRGAIVPLPTYPFERERFWVERPRRAARRTSTRIAVPFSDDAHFEWQVAGESLADHALDGMAVVPAAMYVSLVIESLDGVRGLRDLSFPRALTVPFDGSRTLRLIAGASTFRFVSLDNEREPYSDASWVTHCSGIIDRDGTAVDRVDLDALIARHGEERRPGAGADAGLSIGSSFRRVKSVRAGEREVLCRMDEAETLDAPFIDAALRTLALCLKTGGTYLPLHIGSLRIPGTRAGGWCHARATEIEEGRIVGDVRLIDDDGTVVMEATGLDARQMANISLPNGSESLLEIVWEPLAPQPKRAARWRATNGELATLLTQRGETVVENDPTDILTDARDGAALLDLAKSGTSARVWVLTRNTQPVRPGDRIDPAGAWAWGVGRVMAMESPRSRWTTVDVEEHDPGAFLDHAGTSETELAIRGGSAFAPRVARKAIDALEPPAFRGDASYLITGAFGAIGRQLTRWMIGRGARHLVLTGRTAASPEPLDANVLTISADVGDPDDAARLFAEAAASMPPIRGIFHAAGAIDDALVADLTWERFERVFRPKIDGTRNLHHQSLALELDHFVCFSSAASMIGSRGQANYAAANAFMDALMHHRRALGYPGVSINWSAWAGDGMAAREHDRLRSLGFEPIPPADALELLGRIMQSGATQIGVIPADWRTVLSTLFDQPPPLFANLIAPTAAPAVQAGTREPLLPILERIPADERRRRLEQHLRALIVATMGRDPFPTAENDVSFFDLGMDSLVSLDLRNRLQTDLERQIPSTVAFEYPSIPELADYLMRTVLADVNRETS